MEKFESIFGKFGQMSWNLFMKSALYFVLFALAVFLNAFLKELPTDPFAITKAVLILGSKAGLSALWEQFLVVAMPFIISIVRIDKK